jgi:hypothetical protein
VAIIDARVANASPDTKLLALALRLSELYLRRDDMKADEIRLDEIFLEVPSLLGDKHVFRWDAGVNVFASAGDRRWWQDHRLPGGIAFSVNSVGHMVKSVELRAAMKTFAGAVGIEEPVDGFENVQDLAKALRMAMQTIHGASDANSGKATWLLSADTLEEDAPMCPFSKPAILADTNHCKYQGYYHTDHSTPTSYFDVSVRRPESIQPMELDFTYLFVNDVNNPAYETMGSGVQVRTGEGQTPPAPVRAPNRRGLVMPTVVSRESLPKF